MMEKLRILSSGVGILGLLPVDFAQSQCFAHKMLKYYNIALLPTDPAVNDRFVKQASSLRGYASGYLLGDGAEPHVTLCQFKTDNDECLPAIWAFVKDFRFPKKLEIERFAVREGTQDHAGYDWVQWQVVCVFDDLQQIIHKRLADDDAYLVALTSPETYAPHLTLARVNEETVSEHNPLAMEIVPPFKVTLALGRSTANGEWVETLEKIETA